MSLAKLWCERRDTEPFHVQTPPEPCTRLPFGALRGEFYATKERYIGTTHVGQDPVLGLVKVVQIQ